ncbi:MAG: hypothetical protein M3N21_05730 [Actinomycetota bacterium]|nr:hypothetical protein [Actinomycetota bacterium]
MSAAVRSATGHAQTGRRTGTSPDQLSLPLNVPTLPREASLTERFAAFHTANPHVYRALHSLASRRWTSDLRAGRRPHVGVAALYEALRWEQALRTTGETWRLNNSYRAFYARLLIAARPEWAGFIDTREQKAA